MIVRRKGVGPVFLPLLFCSLGLTHPAAFGAVAVGISAAASPDTIRPNEAVTLSLTLTTTSGKRIYTRVSLIVTDPSGAAVHARQWGRVSLSAGKSVPLADVYTPPEGAAAGDYGIGVKVTNLDQSTVYYDDPTAGSFRVETAGSSFRFVRLEDPNRTVVTDGGGSPLATFTDGSRTVTLTGPGRWFSESTARYPVYSTTYARLLPAPFSGMVDESWLSKAMADTSPDLLQIGLQYIEGAPTLYGDDGRRIAGDADYGPLLPDGTRQEGSDFNDYLGIPWRYGPATDEPEPEQIGSLDCSGFVRMVFGYRGGIPLTLDPDGASLPRRAYQMAEAAPGVVTVPNTGAPPVNLSRLTPGDLVFFDADPGDGPRIDHVGIYLGIDSGGRHRFLSSRKSINGPSLGDYGALSILDGTGYYATAFRAARRL